MKITLSETIRGLAQSTKPIHGNRNLRRLLTEMADEALKLEQELQSLRAFKSSVDEALNSGDGTYRP